MKEFDNLVGRKEESRVWSPINPHTDCASIGVDYGRAGKDAVWINLDQYSDTEIIDRIEELT